MEKLSKCLCFPVLGVVGEVYFNLWHGYFPGWNPLELLVTALKGCGALLMCPKFLSR